MQISGPYLGLLCPDPQCHIGALSSQLVTQGQSTFTPRSEWTISKQLVVEVARLGHDGAQARSDGWLAAGHEAGSGLVIAESASFANFAASPFSLVGSAKILKHPRSRIVLVVAHFSTRLEALPAVVD